MCAACRMLAVRPAQRCSLARAMCAWPAVPRGISKRAARLPQNCTGLARTRPAHLQRLRTQHKGHPPHVARVGLRELRGGGRRDEPRLDVAVVGARVLPAPLAHGREERVEVRRAAALADIVVGQGMLGDADAADMLPHAALVAADHQPVVRVALADAPRVWLRRAEPGSAGARRRSRRRRCWLRREWLRRLHA
eukprot:5943925-Prymnesium_polylepis.1